jgi:hypothetical protein
MNGKADLFQITRLGIIKSKNNKIYFMKKITWLLLLTVAENTARRAGIVKIRDKN